MQVALAEFLMVFLLLNLLNVLRSDNLENCESCKRKKQKFSLRLIVNHDYWPRRRGWRLMTTLYEDLDRGDRGLFGLIVPELQIRSLKGMLLITVGGSRLQVLVISL